MSGVVKVAWGLVCCLTTSILLADEFVEVHVQPYDGRATVGWLSAIDAAGITVTKGEKPSDGAESSGTFVTWDDIRSVRVVPPVSWGKALQQNIAVIDDDGRDRVTSTFGKVKLRKGLHRFELAWVHLADKPRDQRVLQLDYKAPGQANWSEVPDSMYKRQKDWRWADETLSPGLDDEGYRLPDKPAIVEDHLKLRKLSWHGFSEAPKMLPGIKHVPLIQYSGADKIRPFELKVDGAEVNETAGVFAGMLDIPEDGEYRFRLKADGIAAFFVGFRGPRVQERQHVYPDGCWNVELAYGGSIVGKWASLEEKVLSFDLAHGPSRGSPEILKVPLPRKLIKSLVKRQQAQIELPAVSADPSQDVLFAQGTSGSVRGVPGKILRIADEKLYFEFGGDERSVDLERVIAIHFATSELTSGTPPPAPVMMVRPFGAQVIPGRLIHNEQNTRLHFAAIGFDDSAAITKESPETFTMRCVDFRGIDIYGGGAFSLRDMDPTITRTPLFDLAPTFAVDQSPSGGPLKIGSKQFKTGYVLGPRTTLDYLLGGSFRSLNASIGMLAGSGNAGTATVRVIGDGEVLFENDSLTSDDGAQELDVDVRGRNQLRLEIDFGPDFDIGDLVVVGDPELRRERTVQNNQESPSS